MNYLELQQKILPELHLLATKAGVENPKELAKDHLVLAILEKNALEHDQTLAQGYLEISEDGYGFLQDSLLTPESDRKSVV